jgi:hypothetical protein
MLLPAPVAHALSCAQMSLHSQYRWADVVAIGAVLSYETEYVPYPFTPDADGGHEAEVAVERYLKGQGPEVITVTSYTWGMGRPWGEADVGEMACEGDPLATSADNDAQIGRSRRSPWPL